MTQHPDIGKRFNNLLVIAVESRYVGQKNPEKVLFSQCICDCGNTKWIRANRVRTGATKSCGCRMVAGLVERNKARAAAMQAARAANPKIVVKKTKEEILETARARQKRYRDRKKAAKQAFIDSLPPELRPQSKKGGFVSKYTEDEKRERLLRQKREYAARLRALKKKIRIATSQGVIEDKLGNICRVLELDRRKVLDSYTQCRSYVEALELKNPEVAAKLTTLLPDT